MSKSIIQDNWDECYLCGCTRNLEEHHIFGGNPGRQLSEHYGLKVRLCQPCHNLPPEGVHYNNKNMDGLRRIGQKAFEGKYSDKSFITIFGKNYI